jgi:hypothetical protein
MIVHPLPRPRRIAPDAGPVLASLLLASALVALGPNAARADEKGEKVMKLMDASFTKAKDQHFEFEVVTTEPGKAERRLTMDVHIKGSKWRHIHFLAPGDIKGMKVLILDVSQLYVWLPAYRKVRRVASHVRDQGFMGTALSQDDMSVVTYGDLYEGKFLSETKTEWKIEGKLRAGKDFPYPKIEFEIRKDYHQPSAVRYFDAKGTMVKSEARTGYRCQGDICNPAVLKMTDHVRNGIATTLTQAKWETNTGVPDSFFTQRSLQQ